MNALTATPIADQLRSTCAALRRQPIPPAVLIGLMQDAADALDKARRREQELAAQVDRLDELGAQLDAFAGKGHSPGHPEGPDPADETEFQLMAMDYQGQPGELIAATHGARADALLEIVRFMDDVQGPAALFEVVRVPVDLSVMRMGHA